MSSVLLFGTVRQLNLGQCGKKATRSASSQYGRSASKREGATGEKEGSDATCVRASYCCQRKRPRTYARSRQIIVRDTSAAEPACSMQLERSLVRFSLSITFFVI